mgnify:CR=1 FL=1
MKKIWIQLQAVFLPTLSGIFWMVNWMPIWKYVECCTFYICVHETGLAD